MTPEDIFSVFEKHGALKGKYPDPLPVGYMAYGIHDSGEVTALRWDGAEWITVAHFKPESVRDLALVVNAIGPHRPWKEAELVPAPEWVREIVEGGKA